MSEAQPDLDDFFAKKDRKKSKKKFPNTPSELIVNSTSTTAAKKAEPTTGSSTTTQDDKVDEGNEWLDYKEELEKDYSGLKLRQLVEPEPEPEPEVDESQQEDQTPVEPVWKAAPEPKPAPAAAAVAAVKEEPNKSVYISPALRNAALLQPTKLKSKAAPDLGSEMFFPALGTEPPKPVVLGKLTPSSGQGSRPPPRAWGPPPGQSQGVSLGNRYNTLDDES